MLVSFRAHVNILYGIVSSYVKLLRHLLNITKIRSFLTELFKNNPDVLGTPYIEETHSDKQLGMPTVGCIYTVSQKMIFTTQPPTIISTIVVGLQ